VVVVWLVCVAILRRSCGAHTRRSCTVTRWSCLYWICGVCTTVVSIVVLLRWQEFATRSVAVFCLTYHHGGGGGGEYRCSARCIAGEGQSSVPFPSPHASSCRTRQLSPSLIIRRHDAIVTAVVRVTDRCEPATIVSFNLAQVD